MHGGGDPGGQKDTPNTLPIMTFLEPKKEVSTRGGKHAQASENTGAVSKSKADARVEKMSFICFVYSSAQNLLSVRTRSIY